jgi:hypothetical protein
MTAPAGGKVQGKVSAVAGFATLRPQPQDAEGEDLADLGQALGRGHQVRIEGVAHRRDLHGCSRAKDKRL